MTDFCTASLAQHEAAWRIGFARASGKRRVADQGTSGVSTLPNVKAE
jgi:hypothetical protein